jgi:cytochrome c peroxidase
MPKREVHANTCTEKSHVYFAGVTFLPLFGLVASLANCTAAPPAESDIGVQESALSTGVDSMLAPKLNLKGFAQTATPTHTVDHANPFFTPIGSNARFCGTCHLAGEGMTITPAGVKIRFLLSGGTDPLFMPHDGANAPELDVSTFEARIKAYSLLLDRAVIRIGLPVKPTSDFELLAVDDPYGHASATQLSLFRRPLPTTNLKFLAAINWDGRNTVAADPTNIRLGLKNQSNGATVNHAQAPAPIADSVRDSIVDFELGLHTAQVWDFQALELQKRGAKGGPEFLLGQSFTVGQNAPGPGFNHDVFDIYDAWADLGHDFTSRAREDIAEGQQIFNTRTFTVTTATGTFQGTCSGCHTSPNVGGGSVFAMFDVGISASQRRKPEVPLYTFRNKVTGQTIATTDPGRALISGAWADMNKFKVPGLRGLASRAPYFHDGSVSTVKGVVEHYDAHFNIGFSNSEKQKLVAFLEAL